MCNSYYNYSIDSQIITLIKTAASNSIKACIKCKLVKVFPEYNNEIITIQQTAAINIIKARIKRGLAIWV